MNLVEAARRYMDVPFMHRGRSTKGIDCVGLIKCSADDIGIKIEDFLLYGTEPRAGMLEKVLADRLGNPILLAPVQAHSLLPGDIILTRFRTEAHHAGIVTDYRYGGLGVIHAHGRNEKVVEHRLSADMVKKITHVFRINR